LFSGSILIGYKVLTVRSVAERIWLGREEVLYLVSERSSEMGTKIERAEGSVA